jgi:hypothetical protein
MYKRERNLGANVLLICCTGGPQISKGINALCVLFLVTTFDQYLLEPKEYTGIGAMLVPDLTLKKVWHLLLCAIGSLR